MTQGSRNRLAEEASPYLRQHRDNPVHWWPWGLGALQAATESDRPILLSIGYAACHWCHVMAHESFEDESVAAVLNRHFVPVKVDREERPDIDQIYMAALTATGVPGGWPLTMFLTPEGAPFWGGTYFPRDASQGRPGFIQVLEAVAAAWTKDRERLVAGGSELIAHVARHLAGDAGREPVATTDLGALADAIAAAMDPVKGGMAGQPKFPAAPMLDTLWLSWLASGSTQHRDLVDVTLRAMLRGGIYDHVGGGLARYSTDADWDVPHFEKMLYDNAQLLRQACWAYAATRDLFYAARIEETIDWLLEEMRLGNGTFAASLDADSDGEEGAYYTWTRSEVQSALGELFSQFDAVYSLVAPPAWDGNPILRQSPQQCAKSLRMRDIVIEMRRRLALARASRTRPPRDDKALTDWNALAIRALADAGRVMQRSEWIDAARNAYDALRRSASQDGRLPHSALGSSHLFPAVSSDHAAMANAAVALAAATREAVFVRDAEHDLALLETWYGDGSGSAYHLTASDAVDVPVRIRGDLDEAIPSATAQIVEAYARVAAITGRRDLAAKAADVAAAAHGRAKHMRYGQAGIVNACVIALLAHRLVVVDDPRDPSLFSVADQLPDPRRTDLFLVLGTGEPIELADGTTVDTNRRAAYLCMGDRCLAPVHEPDELAKLLESE